MTDRVQLYTGEDACPRCNGWGEQAAPGQIALGISIARWLCPDCRGTGHRDPAREMARLHDENIKLREVVRMLTEALEGACTQLGLREYLAYWWPEAIALATVKEKKA